MTTSREMWAQEVIALAKDVYHDFTAEEVETMATSIRMLWHLVDEEPTEEARRQRSRARPNESKTHESPERMPKTTWLKIEDLSSREQIILSVNHRIGLLLWKLVLEAKSRYNDGEALREADLYVDIIREWTLARCRCRAFDGFIALLAKEQGREKLDVPVAIAAWKKKQGEEK